MSFTDIFDRATPPEDSSSRSRRSRLLVAKRPAVFAAPLSLYLAAIVAASILFTAPAQGATRYWDGTDTTANADGGNGAWTNGGATNWDTLATGGASTAWVAYDDAVFGGTAGTVSITTTVNANSLTFTTSGYTIQGGTLTKGSPTGGPIFSVSAGTAIINSNITSTTNGFNKRGTGTLELGGNVTFSGGASNADEWLKVDAGTLRLTGGTSSNSAFMVLGTDGAEANAQTFAMTGGTMTQANAIYLGNTAGSGLSTLAISGGTFTQTVGGVALAERNSATISVSGTGNATLGSVVAGAFANGQTATMDLGNGIAGGTLSLSALSRTNNTLNLNFNGGTLRATASFTTAAGTFTRINVRDAGATIDTNNQSVTINDAFQHSNFGGDAATDGGLTKSGTGTLTLSGTSTYTGNTTVNQGVLTVTAGGGINGGGTVTVASGATLNANNSNITLQKTWNISGTVNGGSGFSQTLGNTTLSGGTLAGTTGLAGFGNYTIAGASFSITHSGNVTSTISAAGTNGGLTLQGATDLTFNVADGTPAIDLLVSGTISEATGGTAGITKSGAGTMQLSGVNTYTGSTTISAGTLTIGGAGNLGGGSYNGALTINDRLNFTSSYAGGQNLGGTITGTGTLAQNSTLPYLYITGTMTGFQGTFLNTAGSMFIAVATGNGPAGANVQVDGGTFEISPNGATGGTWAVGSLSGSGGVIRPNQNNAGNTYVLQVGALNSDTTFSGVLANNTNGTPATLALTKTGTGTLTLSGSNTYSGATTVSVGTLNITGASSASGYKTTALSIASVATLGINMTGNATSAGANAVGTWAPFNSVAAAVTGSGVLALSGTNFINGAGPGAGFMTTNLSAGGVIDVQSGSWAWGFNRGVALTNLGSLNVVTGAEWRSSDANFRFDALTGGGTVAPSFSGAVTLTLGVSNTTNNATYGVAGNTATFSGTIKNGDTYTGVTTGALSLTKTGTGTQILSAANAYTGTTTVSAGTLKLDGSGRLGSGTYAGAISVTDSATTKLIYNGTGSQIFSGSVSSTGGTNTNLLVSSGTLTLSGATDNGNLVVSVTGGELDLAKSAGGVRAAAGLSNVSGGALVKLTGNGGDQIYGGGAGGNFGLNNLAGTLDLFGHNESVSNFNGSATGVVDNTVAGSFTFTIGETNATGQTFAGIIKNTAGTLNLTKIGTGTQTLSGSNTYTGTTTVISGPAYTGLDASLILANTAGAALQGNVTLGNGTGNSAVLKMGAANQFGASSVITFSAAAFPAQAVFKTMGFNQTVAGLSTNLGTNLAENLIENTEVETGAGAATLTIDNSVNYSYAGQIRRSWNAASSVGALNIVKNGAGTQTLSGANILVDGNNAANSWSGNVTVNQGTLKFDLPGQVGGVNGSIGLTTIGASGVLEIGTSAGTASTGDASHYIRTIQYTGTGVLRKAGTGNQSLSWNVGTTFNFGTGALVDIQGGSVNLGVGGSTTWTNNKADLNLGASGTFYQWDATNVRFDELTGTGIYDIAPVGSGISAGQSDTLTVGVDNGITANFGGVLKNSVGTLSLTKTGTGTQTLSGSNTYTGATTISAGTLKVNGSTAAGSAVAINSGGTLAGSGTVAGTVSVNSGGFISPGNSPGQLNTGAETWNVGGHYTWQLNQVTTGGGSQASLKGTDPGADWLNISGSLTLPGSPSFNIDITGLNTGNVSGNVNNWNPHTSYNWIIASATSISGAFSASNFAVNQGSFTDNNTIGNGTFVLSQSGTNIVLTYNGSTAAATAYWDTNSTTAGAGNPATGTWSNAATNWNFLSAGTGTTFGWTNGDDAVFSAGTDATTAATITISGGVTAHNITVEEGSPTITASTLTLNGTTPTITVNSPQSLTINSQISGSAGLTKTGTGTLTLGNSTNNYTSDTMVSAGTLKLGAANVIPDGATFGNVSVSGTLDLNTFSEAVNGLSGAGTVDTVAGGTPTLTIGGNNATSTFSGVIQNTAGTLSLTKTGSGTLTLSGTAGNTFGGLTLVTNGELDLGKTGVNAIGGNLTVSGGTARLTGTGGDQIKDTGNVVVSGGTLDIVGNSDTVAGVQLTSGTINGTSGTLTSNSTFDLQAGSVSAKLGGTVGANKTTGGTVTYSGANTYSGLTTVSAGELDLNTTGANSISGNLTVSGGTAKLLQGNQIDDAKNVIVGGGTLDIQGNSDTVAGVQLTSGNINGSGGTLTSSGTFDLQAGSVSAKLGGTVGANKTTGGTVTLTGVNSFNGATTISAGTLVVGVGGVGSIANSAVTINGGTLKGSGTTGAVTINAGGTLAPGNSPGTINDVGAVTYASAGTYQWEINSTVGTQGSDPGWDWQNITGGLSVTATTGSKFNVDITGLTTGNVAGAVNAFNKYADYSWNLASATGGISGFSSGVFNLQTANFTNFNNINGTSTSGSFTITTSGNDLRLLYNHAVDNAPAAAYWLGDVNGSWNTNNAGDTNWATTAAGTTDTHAVPSSTSDVFFTTNTAGNFSTTLDADFTINSLTFRGIGDATTNSVTIANGGGGPWTLTVGSGGITVEANSGLHTISSQVALGAAQEWTNDSGNLLTVSGNVSNGANNLTVTGNGDTTIGGALGGGAGGLTKSGNGNLTLEAANTYSGDTDIQQGILTLGAAGSIANSPKITVATGAVFDVSPTGGYSLANGQTLTGEGFLVGDLTVANGSTIAPGEGLPGMLTSIDDLIWMNGSTYDWEVAQAGVAGVDYDTHSVLDTLTFDAGVGPGGVTLDIIKLSGGPINTTDMFALWTYNGLSGWDTGTGIGNPSGLFNYQFHGGLSGTPIVFDDGAGTIWLTGIATTPEPSTIVLGVLGLLGLGFVAMRKKCRRT